MDILPNDNEAKSKVTKKIKCSYKLRNLRQCLMFKPQILKLILKMRQCIRKKNVIITRLKKQLMLLTNLEVVTSYAQTDDITSIDLVKGQISEELAPKGEIKATVNDVYTQTEDILVSDKITKQESCFKGKVNESEPAWNINKEGVDKEKSIAEQVEEVAQSALRETGMVYVDSAGMYYDYKTGYYYNSELGLYYHTDTGCYYYYSDEKQNFVFHSYPDRSAESANASLIMHEKKKAKKHKKAMKSNIDNLTKTFSQGKEEDDSEESSKPKRKKKSHKKKSIEEEKFNTTVNQNIDLETEKNVENNEVEKLVKVESSVKEAEKEEGKEEKDEIEDGECSATDCEEEADKDNDENSDSNDSTSTDTDDESVAKHHPPCMRLIVRESNLQKLKVGSLFLITKDGGSIGREGDQHAIVIRDNNVSRNHLDIRYNLERNVYLAMDLGSKNGTILNGIRMSESQDISEPKEVVHGSVIQLGETKLLCHIHPGNDTCGHCEPGLILESEEKEQKVAYTRTCSIQKQHQLELARLKNKYAKPPLAIEAEHYNDRAQARRETVGSSHHAEKTQSSDLDTFIEPENKGFKLLEKMGWTKGEGLGKDNQGDKEPIPLVSNEGKAGLGTSSSAPARYAPTSNLGPATLRLATRTKMLQPPAKVFQDQLGYDSE
ncbi:unnamed protein product [Parnassius apollo]|uniref:(apollo) hypothetical protein n=1 Tax=Parnassius apollo TaxID=110799 RepID=A0A8S3YC71_PARAO|nr:unnamed protein product [Parnassius apollo]